MAKIWQDVLQVEPIGIHDNFFDLGGDSLLSMQVAALTARSGIQLTPNQIYKHQTVAELAQEVGSITKIYAEQGIVTGPVPLTPSARQFLERKFPDIHHYNESQMYEARQILTREQLECVMRNWLAHHDALRLRFVREGSRWKSFIAGVNDTVPVEWIDLSRLGDSERTRAIETTAAEAQGSLNLSEGPICRVVFLYCGSERPGRLLVVIHHIAFDAFSSLAVDDLLEAYQQKYYREPIRFPDKTTSFKHWAESLAAYAHSDLFQREVGYWLQLPWESVGKLPLDHRGSNTRASSVHVETCLSPEETAVLFEIPRMNGTPLRVVLLTAFSQALVKWTGSSVVAIDLMRHGRDPIFADLDLSRTAGNFITYVPVVVDLEEIHKPGDALNAVSEQYNRIPNGGMGYGLLRSMSDKAGKGLRTFPRPEIAFNNRAQFSQDLDETPSQQVEDWVFRKAQEDTGPPQSETSRREHVIGHRADIEGGTLQFGFTYSRNLQRSSTVEKLVSFYIDSLKVLIGIFQDR